MIFDSVECRGTDKFPASKYSIVDNFTQNLPLRDGRI